jgi:hypothetical protein
MQVLKLASCRRHDPFTKIFDHFHFFFGTVSHAPIIRILLIIQLKSRQNKTLRDDAMPYFRVPAILSAGSDVHISATM